MKKQLISVAALSSIVSVYAGTVASEGSVTVDVSAENSLANVLDLRFTVNNTDAATHKVRLEYNLPDDASYVIDRVNSVTCTEDQEARKLPGAIYNLKKSQNQAGNDVYALDLQFNQPSGYQSFCLTITRSDLSNFKPFGQEVDITAIDQDGSPLDNPVIYNYVPKQRHANNVAQYQGAFPQGALVEAKVVGYSNGTKNVGINFSTADGNLAYIPATVWIDLNVDSYGMYRDTRMLAASFGELVDEYRWNQSTFDGNMYNGVESRTINMGRCWSIAVFNLYSYFYGNRNTKSDALTQDEMVYKAETDFEKNDRQIGVFIPSEGEGADDNTSEKLINYVFKNANAVHHNYKKEPLTVSKLYNILALEGTPLFISVTTADANENPAGHALLIDGIATDAEGKYLVHLVNLDNFGNEAYVYFDNLADHWSGYITYNAPIESQVTKTDMVHPVDFDSDHDGIVDFDEYNRFKSDEYQFDSDDDEISDFDEIYSYISTIEMNVIDDNELSLNKYPFTFSYEDSKKSIYPQNNDKVKGYVKDLGPAVDIPEDVALYALDWISYNDNVVCFNQGSVNENLDKDDANCNIVSEGTSVDNYVVNVGSRSYLGSIFSKGKVWIRDGARVNAAYMYNANAKVDVQGNSTKNPYKLYLKSSNWRFNVNKELPAIDVGSETKIVSNGQTYNLKDGDKFAFLKVESGGTLYIEPGTMYVGNIQLESGAKYAFTDAAVSTILHLDGSVIWRATLDEDYCRSAHISKYGALRETVTNAVARGFKTYQHHEGDMFIDSPWYGTLIAPKSKLVLAQPSHGKTLAGQFLAKVLVVHQNTKIYQVNYSPFTPTVLAKKAAAQENTIENNDVANESLSGKSISIVSVNQETLSFETATAGNYQIFIGKVDGSKVASFNFNNAQVGVNTANIASAKLIRGRYIVAVKHNGSVASKMVLVK